MPAARPTTPPSSSPATTATCSATTGPGSRIWLTTEPPPARCDLTVLEVNKPGQRTRAVRTLDWLYVHWENGGFEELYDLRADPFQLNDLASAPGHTSICRDL